MKSIVFMVNTEYHLLLSVGIIQQYFNSGYKLLIYRVSPKDGTRLNNVCFNSSDIIYKQIIYDYRHPQIHLKVHLNEIIDVHPDIFFFFLENKFWMGYFFSRLHKKGTKIILGPDGMKAYSDYTVPLLSIVKNTFKGFVYSIESKIFFPPFVERCYATSKYIDEVWVDNKEKFKNRTNKKVIEFIIPHDESYVADLNKIFMVKKEDFLLMKEKTILFLDSPFSSEPYYDKTIHILKELQNKYTDRKLAIKLHQLSSNKARKKYRSISGVFFVESQYPAELYIANAKDCIVVSLISTSLLFYNPCCRYYWIYPMFKQIVDYSNIKNPTKHIKVVESIAEF